MDKKIAAAAEYWSQSSVFDPETQQEISELIANKNTQELEERFYRNLEFGTGGLRGILGAGTNRMNIYNIRKASHALASYLKSHFKQPCRVAISFDSRRFSADFAQAAAGILAKNGIETLITQELRPVPMLSFMVRHFGCHAGICVTASHNPPEYNGFKVYWQTGGQIVPPHDKKIIDLYNQISSYDELEFISYQDGLTQGKIREIGPELDEPYFEALAGLCHSKPGKKDFRIVYSPLHGSGTLPVTRGLKEFGFENVFLVPEQEKPDGNFPTVSSPNPEDPAAMKMALALGLEKNADLVMATDPDADRIGLGVRENDEYIVFNGNQIGSLLVDFVLGAMQEAKKLPANPLVIKTIVTTDLQAKIAAYYGADCEETLTGFKWICQLIEDYETGKKTPYRRYVCGGEESYGFLADTFVRDKDAVLACCIAAEMVSYIKSQGKTVTQVLWDLFRRHGVFQDSLYTMTLPGKKGAETIQALMSRLREQPLREVAGIPVISFRDLSLAKEVNFETEETATVPLPKSNVLQFKLEDGSKISVRPSGTEPKIKFYFSVYEAVEPDITDEILAAEIEKCRQRLDTIQNIFEKLASDS